MSQALPSTPPRRCSISKAVQRDRSPTPDDAEAIETKRQQLNDEVKRAVKKLKPQHSLDSDFWGKSKSIASLRKESKMLVRKLSLSDFRKENPAASYESWEASTAAIELNEQIKSYELDERIFGEQERRVLLDRNAPDYDSKIFKRHWLELLTKSSAGLHVNTAQRERDSCDQANFRRSCITDYQTEHPDEQITQLWCPVLQKYEPPAAVVAGHIFAYQHGQTAMTAIFGTDGELFSSKNGLMISAEVEERWAKGLILIVPDLPDEPSVAASSLWNNSEPKSYKIRVTDPDHPLMRKYIELSEMRWRDLNDRKLVFKGDARPGARYLYWHYCITMLRRSWVAGGSHKVLKDQFGRKFWGTPGKYVNKNMIDAIILELGHEYDALLDGADETTSAAPKEEQNFGILAATRQIRLPCRTNTEETDSDDYYDSDSDDEDTYEY